MLWGHHRCGPYYSVQSSVPGMTPCTPTAWAGAAGPPRARRVCQGPKGGPCCWSAGHSSLELGHFLFKRSLKGQAGTPLETRQSGVCEWGISFGWEGGAEGGKEKRQFSQGANPKQPWTTPGPQPSETRPFTSQFKLRRAPSPAPLPLPEPQGNRATPPLKSQLCPPPAGGDPEVTLGLPLHPGARPSI